ncbi:hypothetical protein [Nocardioides sp. NPDC006273]|uniref:hypothetical protein n=1 Tax=Nocardioides sp. NPDC006273 TaxID=3155598 RepID=UPI0033A4868E
MERLRTYVEGADEAVLDDLIRRWDRGERRFRSAGQALHDNGKKVEDGFSSASKTGPAARRGMQQAGEKTSDKSDVLKEAVAAMRHFRGTLSTARSQYAKLAADLPDSHGPAPDPADFPTKGVGVDGEANTKLLKAAQSKHAADEAKIAHAETEAAAQVGYVDDAVREDEPKVRALFDDGTNSQPLPAGTPTSQPGSYSQIQASKARIAATNSGTLYPDGMGYEIHERERENIKAYEAANEPEWNGTQWIDAHGSPAPATSYAMVETAEGLAPMAGGPGASALAIGGGMALGAGIAKAVASKLGGARASGAQAKASAAGKTAASGARSAATASKAGASGARAGALGSAGRAGGTGAQAGRGGKAGMASAGSRQSLKNAGRTGAGAAGARGGRGKDDDTGEVIDYQADYSKDYSDDEYEKLIEQQRLEQEQRKRYRGDGDD